MIAGAERLDLHHWSAELSAALGGYPRGCVVRSNAHATLRWESTVDDNTSDPDRNGPGWRAVPAP